MLDRPALLAGIAVTLLGILAAALHEGPAVRAHPGDAPLHEGQRVVLSGALVDVRPAPGGATWFTLADDGSALDARIDATLSASRGAWVEAEGDLRRLDGRLVLLAHRAHVTEPPGPAEPGWSQLAADPGAWTGRLLRVTGTVEDGLLQGDRHALRLGDGDWPDAGAVRARGILAYEPRCLCHVLHADRVETAWTA